MEAVQTAAMIHDICIGKTGTITKGNGMKIKKIQLFNHTKVYDASDSDG